MTNSMARRARMRIALIICAALFLTGTILALLWVNTYMVR